MWRLRALVAMGHTCSRMAAATGIPPATLSLRLRILLPDPQVPWTLPSRTDDLGDDPAFRERMGRIANRHTSAIVDSVHELAELGAVEDAAAEVRVHRSAPLFKRV